LASLRRLWKYVSKIMKYINQCLRKWRVACSAILTGVKGTRCQGTGVMLRMTLAE
jgi:hypothetical protein